MKQRTPEKTIPTLYLKHLRNLSSLLFIHLKRSGGLKGLRILPRRQEKETFVSCFWLQGWQCGQVISLS